MLCKRGEEQFLSFPQDFLCISNFRSQITYSYVIWLFDLFFLNSANLICRGMDISKYFKEFLGLRDNESRLYMYYEETCRM